MHSSLKKVLRWHYLKRLILLAIVNIMVAFGAALSILLKERRVKWAPISIDLLECVLVYLFTKLQLPLFIEMVIFK